MAESNEENRKSDIKPRYDLIPPELLEGTATILTLSEDKHKDNSWELGNMTWGQHFSALMRHLWKWWSPLHPDTDDETGRSHLWHAASRIGFLIAYEVRGIGIDDRNKRV